MEDKQLISQIRRLKEERRYTLHDLSRRLDIQIATLERWLKTNRINRLYARFIKDKLKKI
jgi:transcriptional regulator with XRE-family HTH domain